ncbi:MAG TPA: sensor domain-containing diguanylate cyclase [Planctomycetes bacterium]|nr:sensor domain-containing diguanylate cyclase [Planctomycetota bacterium]
MASPPQIRKEIMSDLPPPFDAPSATSLNFSALGILEHLQDPVLAVDQEGRILWRNEAASLLPDLPAEPLSTLIREQECASGRRIVTRTLRLADGSTLAVRVHPVADESEAAAILVLMDETPAQRRLRRLQFANDRLQARLALLERQAHLDALTGLLNRRGLARALEREARQGRRAQAPLSALFIDFDDFKKLNDHFGHYVGDRVLSRIAHRMESLLRPRDHLGRIGGDEFLLLLPSATSLQAEVVAERLRQAVAAEVFRDDEGRTIRTTISVAVTRVPEEAPSIEGILRRARGALQRAKRSGKNLMARADS